VLAAVKTMLGRRFRRDWTEACRRPPGAEGLQHGCVFRGRALAQSSDDAGGVTRDVTEQEICVTANVGPRWLWRGCGFRCVRVEKISAPRGVDVQR